MVVGVESAVAVRENQRVQGGALAGLAGCVRVSLSLGYGRCVPWGPGGGFGHTARFCQGSSATGPGPGKQGRAHRAGPRCPLVLTNTHSSHGARCAPHIRYPHRDRGLDRYFGPSSSSEQRAATGQTALHLRLCMLSTLPPPHPGQSRPTCSWPIPHSRSLPPAEAARGTAVPGIALAQSPASHQAAATAAASGCTDMSPTWLPSISYHRTWLLSPCSVCAAAPRPLLLSAAHSPPAHLHCARAEVISARSRQAARAPGRTLPS